MLTTDVSDAMIGQHHASPVGTRQDGEVRTEDSNAPTVPSKDFLRLPLLNRRMMPEWVD